MTVGERKKRLIKDNLQKNANAMSGMKITGISVLSIIVLRLLFLLYELIYFSSVNVKISIVSALLVLPMMLVLYMVYDGNKGLAAVTVISAVIRIIYHFSSVYSDLPGDAAANIYTVILITVMAAQFILSLTITASKMCTEYSKIRQAVNMQIRIEIMKK